MASRLDHALRLAELGFFVFPLQAYGKKPPKDMHFKKLSTRDEAQIRAWWAEHDWNIGLYTGKFADNEALLVVDVDTKEGKHGNESLLRHELEGRELPDTFTQSTPTGGRHLVYRVGSPVRQGANVLGDGLDVRSRGGYIVAAGSRVDAGEYAAEVRPVLPAPVWLVDACGTARARRNVGDERLQPARNRVDVDADRARERAIHYLQHEAPLAIEGQGGDDTTYMVAARLKDIGIARDIAVTLLHEHWNQRCSPPWLPNELGVKVDNAYKYGQNPPGAAAPEAEFTKVELQLESSGATEKLHPFDELNRHYAHVLAGGGDHILWETTDEKGEPKIEHLNYGSFQRKLASRKMMVGKKEAPLTQLWMEYDKRRSYDGLVFMPEQKAPERFYNLWRGFSYVPSEKTKSHPAVEAFLEHTRANVCRGDSALFRWLIGYFAHLVQRPWEKPLVALVFRGAKGVGKNAVVERIGALLGSHFLLTSNRRYLVGNFNGHLERTLLFALDEAFWSGDKQAEGTVKDLITGKTHVIEHKGKEPYTVANVTRVVIIGNESWLIPASHDERRFAVFDVGDGRKQDRSFFAEMREGMEVRGGYSCLLQYLLDYPLDGIDINAAPNTQALTDQKHLSLDPLQQWWLDCLEEGRIIGAEFAGWPAEIECERFRNAFRRYVKERNIRSRIPDDRTIGRLMKQCAPGVFKKRMSRQDDGGQPYAYRVPSVEISRTSWETFIGHKVEWPA